VANVRTNSVTNEEQSMIAKTREARGVFNKETSRNLGEK
jgi:hypothetical protein